MAGRYGRSVGFKGLGLDGFFLNLLEFSGLHRL